MEEERKRNQKDLDSKLKAQKYEIKHLELRFEELVDKQGDYIIRKEFKEAIGNTV